MPRPEVGRQRLASHRLVGALCATPAEVVAHLGALQAQDEHQARWALALRTASCTPADVDAALADRSVVRTWALRGTLQYVSPQNAAWMVELSRDRRLAGVRTRERSLGLDAEAVALARRLLEPALAGGVALARADVFSLWSAGGLSPEGQRGYHLLWHLAHLGVLCLGPRVGKQDSFVLLEEWVPRPWRPTRDEALAELARLYRQGHAPATVEDFAWWAGLTLTDARYGWAASSGEPPPEAPTGVQLLPGFDEWYLGYTDRSAGVEPEFALRVTPGANGIFQPIVVSEGEVVGTWKRQGGPTGRQFAVDLFPGKTVDPTQLEACKKRLVP